MTQTAYGPSGAASSSAADGLAIDLRHVAKVYKGKVHALQGIEMHVRRGEVFGLLGPNGAGKSTLVKIMMTVIRPTRAEGTILGSPVGHKPTLRKVGYLPENHRFPRYLTGRQTLEFFAALSDVDRPTRKRRAGELLETVGMKDWADKKVSTYSKGMMQRIGLAQALAADPDLVVLDEPTDGVDPVGRRDIQDVHGPPARAEQDRLHQQPPAQRIGGDLRPGGDPGQGARGQAGDDGRVDHHWTSVTRSSWRSRTRPPCGGRSWRQSRGRWLKTPRRPHPRRPHRAGRTRAGRTAGRTRAGRTAPAAPAGRTCAGRTRAGRTRPAAPAPAAPARPHPAGRTRAGRTRAGRTRPPPCRSVPCRRAFRRSPFPASCRRCRSGTPRRTRCSGRPRRNTRSTAER